MNTKCPQCAHEYNVELMASVPATQVFRVKLTSESPVFAAATIGKTIINTEKLLVAVAKDIGASVSVMLQGFSLKEKEAEMTFVIAANKPKEKSN